MQTRHVAGRVYNYDSAIAKVGTGGSKENVHRALSDSLKRLQVDYVDIFKLHLPDAATEVLETLSAFNNEIKEGATRAIGCANHNKEQLPQYQQM